MFLKTTRYGADDYEREVISVMVARRGYGDTIAGVCRWLRLIGRTTRTGGPWHATTVARVLRRHRWAPSAA